MKSALKKYIKEFLNEGKHDQNTYKCVIVLGPAGVGKSTAIRKIVSGTGLKYLNSDKFLEMDIDKELEIINQGEDWKSEEGKARVKSGELTDRDKWMNNPDNAEMMNKLYRKAAKLNDKRLESLVSRRIGIVLEGTAGSEKSYEWYHNNFIKPLHTIGYDILVVGIYAPVHICLQRNTKRGKEGGRAIPNDMMQSIFYGFIDEYYEIITKASDKLYKAITILNTEFDDVSRKKIMNYVHMINHPNSVKKSKYATLRQLNNFILNLVESDPDIVPDDLSDLISQFLTKKEGKKILAKLRVLQDMTHHNDKEQHLLNNAVEINQLDAVVRTFLSANQKSNVERYDDTQIYDVSQGKVVTDKGDIE